MWMAGLVMALQQGQVSSTQNFLAITLLILSSQLQLTSAAASQECQDYASGTLRPAGTQNILELGCCEFSVPSGAANPFCTELVNGTNLATPSVIDGATSDSNNKILLSTGQTCTPLCGNTKVTTFNIMGGGGGILTDPYCSSGADSEKEPNDGGPEPPAYDTTCQEACAAGAKCEQLSWRYSPCCKASFGGPCKPYGWKILKTCRQTKKGSLAIINLHLKSIQEGADSSLAYTCKSGSYYKNPPVSGSYEYVPVYQCTDLSPPMLRPGKLGIWAACGLALWMLICF